MGTREPENCPRKSLRRSSPSCRTPGSTRSLTGSSIGTGITRTERPTRLANMLDNKLREDLERLKKIRAHRGLRHYWGLRVRGQHTKTTGHKGKTVGVSKKK